jgi:hypothetical protein
MLTGPGLVCLPTQVDGVFEPASADVAVESVQGFYHGSGARTKAKVSFELSTDT